MSTAAEQMVSRLNLPFCTGLHDCKTVREAIEKAGLNYEVSLEKLITTSCIESNKMATVRKDKQKILGYVSDKYSILQNVDAFNFFEEFVENGLVTLETAGSLYDGEKIFILAKITGDNMYITDEDVVEKYILLSNSFNGKNSIRVGFTSIRVVCCNMLTMVHKNSASQLLRVNHKGDITNTLSQIQGTMDLVNKQFLATEEKYKLLTNIPVNNDDLKKYVKTVFSKKKQKELENIVKTYDETQNEKEAIESERKRLIARIDEIFDTAKVYNAWGAYNAINSYLNHDRSKDYNKRYNQLWFYDSASYDRKALEEAFKIGL